MTNKNKNRALRLLPKRLSQTQEIRLQRKKTHWEKIKRRLDLEVWLSKITIKLFEQGSRQIIASNILRAVIDSTQIFILPLILAFNVQFSSALRNAVFFVLPSICVFVDIILRFNTVIFEVQFLIYIWLCSICPVVVFVFLKKYLAVQHLSHCFYLYSKILLQ